VGLLLPLGDGRRPGHRRGDRGRHPAGHRRPGPRPAWRGPDRRRRDRLRVPGVPVQPARADGHRDALRSTERDRRLAAGARRARHPGRRLRPRRRPGPPHRQPPGPGAPRARAALAGLGLLPEGRSALAGGRRVPAGLPPPAAVSVPAGGLDPHTGNRLDPAPGVTPLPEGLLDIEVTDLRYSYPTGPEVLHGLTVSLPARSRGAIVGETGSGQTTFAKLLTRMMDPASGQILVCGVPLYLFPYSSLRARVAMVTQEGIQFDSSVAGNLLYAKPDAAIDQMQRSLDELGLGEGIAALPSGLDTPVGPRGDYL